MHLAWLWLAVAIVLGVVLALRIWRRRRAVPRDAWLVLELRDPLVELPRSRVGPWWRRFVTSPVPPSVASLRRVARIASSDPRVKGVLVRLHDVQCGWATAATVREVFTELRAKGKRVVAYVPYGAQSRGYYIALAADRILASPQATLAPVGVAAGSTFLRSFLARGGIEAEVLARREYKSAAEQFTRDDLSEPNREQLSALLDTLHDALVAAMVESRTLTTDEARARIDGAPYRAREAVENGLIDAVAYDDELARDLESDPKHFVPFGTYAALARPWRVPFVGSRRRRVGIVEVRGSIVNEAPVALGRVADAPRVIGALRAARADPKIGAVVLYVDSPGGSALASDLIAREVERLAEKKPVVAYFADVAASGGFYVAAPAHAIVASPVGITGSIGVIALRFVFEGTLQRLGIGHQTLRRGERADLTSPYRHWTDAERAVLDREIDGFYRDFVGIVARGRKRPYDEIEPLARGRVWSGRDAHARGLVDTLGGLDTALREAASRGGLRASDEPVIVRAPRQLPEPPEPPAAVQPIVARLVNTTDLLNLALGAGREHLFAYEPVNE